MAPSFNLLEQPFVPCVIQGRFRELSLLDTLREAHHVEELCALSPLVTVALHRLLLAILHSVFGPKSNRAWAILWNKGQFDAPSLEGYLNPWRSRFDLFDERFPFFQDARYLAKKRTGIQVLVRELSRGNNSTLFDHTMDDCPPAISPAAAARALITEQAFAVGGGNSDLGYTSSAPLIGGVIVLLDGQNLFQTLLLNLVNYPDGSTYAGIPERDKPVWERETRPSEEPPTPFGLRDLLTWPSRSIRLHAEQDGTVRWISYAMGRVYTPLETNHDPMVPILKNPKGNRKVRLDEERALWRDSTALLEWTDETGESSCQPGVLLARSARQSMELLEGLQPLSLFGIANDKAKVLFWRREKLVIPSSYLQNDGLVLFLRTALRLAEEAGDALRSAVAAHVRCYLGTEQKPADSEAVWKMVDSLAAERIYWSGLELPFRQFILSLPGTHQEQSDRVQVWYRDVVVAGANKALRETIKLLPQRSRMLKAVATQSGLLGWLLDKMSRKIMVFVQPK